LLTTFVSTALLSFTNAQYGRGYGSGSDSGGGYGGSGGGYESGSDPSTTTSSSSASTPSSSNSKSDIPFSSFSFNTGNGKVDVSLNVPSSGNDLYFHMTGSDKNSWIAFGIGASMTDNALVFVAYRSSDGKSITVSPRLATEHSQPQHDPVKDISVTVLSGSGVSNGNIVVNAKCTNCRSWSGNSVDVKSTKQPMIIAAYASDSGSKLQSDDLSANILQHSERSQFTMNLVQATGNGGVPGTSLGGSTSAGNSGSSKTSENNTARTIHAILMLTSFLFLYPLGVIYLRVLDRVWLHWLNQSFATLLIAVAAAIGIIISIRKKIVSLHLNHSS
jgi:hypothetical protein